MDTLRVVSLKANDEAEVLLDLNDTEGLALVKGTFTLTPGEKSPMVSNRERRWGGSQQVGETTANAKVAWHALVFGETADACLAQANTALAMLESNPWRLLLEWKPDGASDSTYFEIRGAVTWGTEYQWARFAGTQALVLTAELPVAPLARGLPLTVSLGANVTTPNVLVLEPMEGDALVEAALTLTTNAVTAAPVWALFGWAAITEGAVPAAFGILEGESSTGRSGWTTTVNTAEAYGGKWQGTEAASSATKYEMGWEVDARRLDADPFTNEVAVEVWARVIMAPTLKTPKLLLSARPSEGAPAATYGAPRYTDEWGSRGCQLVPPSGAAARYRLVRLGTLHLPADPVRDRPWTLWLEGPVASGSSGSWGVDYLLCVPVNRRACGPTAKVLDATYPRFISSTTNTRKTIYHDLSAATSPAGQSTGYTDHGLGGQLLELPPGDCQLLVKLSNLVPNDPTSNESSETLSMKVAVSLKYTPRWYLARA